MPCLAILAPYLLLHKMVQAEGLALCSFAGDACKATAPASASGFICRRPDASH